MFLLPKLKFESKSNLFHWIKRNACIHFWTVLCNNSQWLQLNQMLSLDYVLYTNLIRFSDPPAINEKATRRERKPFWSFKQGVANFATDQGDEISWTRKKRDVHLKVVFFVRTFLPTEPPVNAVFFVRNSVALYRHRCWRFYREPESTFISANNSNKLSHSP